MAGAVDRGLDSSSAHAIAPSTAAAVATARPWRLADGSGAVVSPQDPSLPPRATATHRSSAESGGRELSVGAAGAVARGDGSADRTEAVAGVVADVDRGQRGRGLL